VCADLRYERRRSAGVVGSRRLMDEGTSLKLWKRRERHLLARLSHEMHLNLARIHIDNRRFTAICERIYEAMAGTGTT